MVVAALRIGLLPLLETCSTTSSSEGGTSRRTSSWGSFQRRQEQLVARCEAIWLWGVAHGAARETGRYVAVQDEGMQKEREVLERDIGLAVPRQGQPA